MDTKHTPGPWVAVKTAHWHSLYDRDANLIAQTALPKSYYTEWPSVTNEDGSTSKILSTKAAVEQGLYVPTEEHKAACEAKDLANARLIAAAPELLAALRALHAMVADYHDEWIGTQAMSAARAAIAKAEGKL